MRADDALGAVAALAASQHGAFDRRQAAAEGLHRNQVRRLLAAKVLEEPIPGVLVIAGSPVTWRRRLMVVTLTGRGAIASVRSAAALHGLDGFPEREIEVHVPRRTGLEADAVIVHRVRPLERRDRCTIDGIPCTGLARTLADLGDHVPAALVGRALDDARRRRTSLRWLRETAERLVRPNCRGPSLLLELLDAAEREPRVPDSWFERLLEEALACPELPPLVRQHAVRAEDGRVVARVDLAMPSIRLAVEAHSRRFHFGAARERADEDRDLALAELGWDVVYLGWQATLRPSEALARLQRIVAARQVDGSWATERTLGVR